MMTMLGVGAFVIGISASFLIPAVPFILFVAVGIGAGALTAILHGQPFGSVAWQALLLVCATEVGYVVGLIGRALAGHRSKAAHPGQQHPSAASASRPRSGRS